MRGWGKGRQNDIAKSRPLTFRWSSRAMVLGNFQCRGVVLIWIPVGQGPTAFAVGADEGFSIFFSHSLLTPNHIFSFSLSIGDGSI